MQLLLTTHSKALGHVHPRGFFLHVTATWRVPCVPGDRPAPSSALPQSLGGTEQGTHRARCGRSPSAPCSSVCAGREPCSRETATACFVPAFTLQPDPSDGSLFYLSLWFFENQKAYKYCPTIFVHFAFLVQLMYSSVPFLFSFFFHFFPERTGTDLCCPREVYSFFLFVPSLTHWN